MTRFDRKNRQDIKSSLSNGNSKNGIFDLIDDTMKSVWRINDDEYDYIIDNLSDDELKVFSLSDPSITDIKMMISKVNELVFKYQNRRSIEREEKLKNIL